MWSKALWPKTTASITSSGTSKLTRDMLHREAEHGQWVGQLDRLTARCEEMRGDEEWDCRDTDALVDGFTRDIEREADAASEVARISGELAMYNAAYYNPETGDLIVSYLRDYEDPTVEVFSYTPDELLDEIARQGGDLENLELNATPTSTRMTPPSPSPNRSSTRRHPRITMAMRMRMAVPSCARRFR